VQTRILINVHCINTRYIFTIIITIGYDFTGAFG
jgi:hypothetical protein